MFKRPELVLYQRAGALDLTLTATKHTALDKNNSLDLKLSTGWNDIESCELRIKPATGGLRLIATEAKIVGSTVEFAKPPEAGAFFFGAISPDQTVTVQFPYSVEQDVTDVMAKLEITYYPRSDDSSYYFTKSVAAPVALALGVNVQDVFKHQALFSRFSVTTASSSPLRLFKSKLLDSDLFESTSGTPHSSTITVFPRQSASLLHRVRRKHDIQSAKRSARTMYLKLYFSVLQTEVEELVEVSVAKELEAADLGQYAKPVCARVVAEFRRGIQSADLERVALLGGVTTAFLADHPWERHFAGYGRVAGSQETTAAQLASFLRTWQQKHVHIPVPASVAADPSTILIPVEIPSVSVVHTSDIRLQTPSSTTLTDPGTTVVHVNQMLSAILHLKWTRIWDTESIQTEDQEFSYEVTAPADTFLLGGRRKGHFVIPGDSSPSSTPETEASIPLILIPLREGYLPYPSVEIREVPATVVEATQQQQQQQPCEVDFRNLGETIRVVDEKTGVTVSLDASGPGGGPLVLETEGSKALEGRIVA